MKGYMYILECADGSYYTGSTINLDARLRRHQNGEGANHTKKHLPVKLVYFEEYDRIDKAFYREKQVQRWGRRKKEALIKGEFDKLRELARNHTQYGPVPSTSSGTGSSGTGSSGTGSSGTGSSMPATAPEPVEGPSQKK